MRLKIYKWCVRLARIYIQVHVCKIRLLIAIKYVDSSHVYISPAICRNDRRSARVWASGGICSSSSTEDLEPGRNPLSMEESPPEELLSSEIHRVPSPSSGRVNLIDEMFSLGLQDKIESSIIESRTRARIFSSLVFRERFVWGFISYFSAGLE